MTGVLIKRGNLDPDRQRADQGEDSGRRGPFTSQGEVSGDVNPADTLISDF